ncbi:ubiquitin carboxyl-terminal hydrolase 24-like isoform X2 [Curcuma longa]|uniref:ubiquitin carboxyl-terminal hydrolase 24-like isoform X2 n=1 Tax=Curcuma longa TaxID=136217 RepID=UPI003D9EED18
MSGRKLIMFGSFTEDETRLFQSQYFDCMHSLDKAGQPCGSLDLTSNLYKGSTNGPKVDTSSEKSKGLNVSDAISDLIYAKEAVKVNDSLQKVTVALTKGSTIDSCQSCRLIEKGKDALGLTSLRVTDKGASGVELAEPKDQEGWIQTSNPDNFSPFSLEVECPKADVPRTWTEKGGTAKSIRPRGLINLGNLCFLNATLQALLACSPFVELLQDLRNRNISKMDYTTLYAFVEFISEFNMPDDLSTKASGKAFLESGKPFSPIMFDVVLKRFTPDMPTGISSRPRQEDAQEFLNFIMDQMHDELLKLNGNFSNRNDGENALISSAEDEGWETVGPKNKSAITRTQSFMPSQLSAIFGGQYRSVVKARGKKASATVQPFLLLHLDIFPESVTTIEDALHLFAASESLEGYRISDGSAGLVSASKSVKIQQLPKIMILHLMRFSYGSRGSTKLHKPVHFPLDLVLGRELLASPTSESRRYELVATITHHGQGPSHGHYTTDAKTSTSHWLHYDDSSVMAITTNKVLHDHAYILFYKQT